MKCICAAAGKRMILYDSTTCRSCQAPMRRSALAAAGGFVGHPETCLVCHANLADQLAVATPKSGL